MSTKYKKSSEVPTSVLCDRLKQLSDAITKGRPNDNEFTMRIPAECDRDADIVMSEAAKRLLHAESELEAIKKQEPAETAYAMPGASGFTIAVFWSEKVPAGSPVYTKPVYQHSFTVDGHTFYADNEVDILYLERKFGVGGKAKLNLVEDQ